MNRLSCFLLIAILLAACLSGCGGSGEPDDGTVVFRLASDASSGNIMYDLLAEMCEEVETKTEGRVQIDFYPASQLGSYETVFSELMMGTIDMAHLAIPETYDSRAAIGNLAGYARDYDEVKELYANDSVMAEIYEDMLSGFDIRLLSLCMEGLENVASAKPVKDPFVPGADKGVKCRTSPYDQTRQMLEDLGYETVTITWSEIPTSLQTGIVDAWMGGKVMEHDTYTGDAIQYSYICNLQPSLYPVVITEASYAKLSQEDQNTLREIVESACAKGFELAEQTEEEYARKLRDKGVEVVYATEEERAAIADYLRTVTWPKFEEKFTREYFDKVISDLQARGYM